MKIYFSLLKNNTEFIPKFVSVESGANTGFEFGHRKVFCPNCLIPAPIMVGGEENLWFQDALNHFVSELILPEKTWKGIKTVDQAPNSALRYDIVPEFPPGWMVILVSLLITLNTFNTLTHFMSLFSFCTPWKHQKTSGFLFSGGIEREQWHEMNWFTAFFYGFEQIFGSWSSVLILFAQFFQQNH